MSERFPDEVLREALNAYNAAWKPTSRGRAAGIAAMRAVLEGHLAARDEPFPVDQLMTENARLRGQSRLALTAMREALEQLRVAVMVEVSNPHQDWTTARANLTRALNEAFAPGVASDGSPR